MKQQPIVQQPPKQINGTIAGNSPKTAPAPVKEESLKEKREQNDSKNRTKLDEQDEQAPNGLGAFQEEEAITVVHAPLSGEQWRADLEKAGKQLSPTAGKKANVKAEDEAQLVRVWCLCMLFLPLSLLFEPVDQCASLSS